MIRFRIYFKEKPNKTCCETMTMKKKIKQWSYVFDLHNWVKIAIQLSEIEKIGRMTGNESQNFQT